MWKSVTLLQRFNTTNFLTHFLKCGSLPVSQTVISLYNNVAALLTFLQRVQRGANLSS